MNFTSTKGIWIWNAIENRK